MNSDPVTADLIIGGFAPPVPFFAYLAAQDDIVEDEECLVFSLSINETALDPRDQGQVDFDNSVALVRIEDEQIGKQTIPKLMF